MSKDWATNWELHDGAVDGYLDEEKDRTSKPEDNLPLSRTVTLNTNSDDNKQASEPLAKRKAVMGGNLYRKVSNRKKRDPYFNLVNKDIIESSEHTITLDNGQVLCKSDLAIKGKILPGPKKIIVNQTPTGHKLHTHSSLAGKRKLSLPKKAVSTPSGRSGQGTSRAIKTRAGSSAPTVSAATHDSSRISSGSSSSLNLDTWDGKIDDYFDDVTNNNIPQSHHSKSNQGLSLTGTIESPHPSSERQANTDLREIVIITNSTEAWGSQDNPILLDSTPEPTVSPTIKPRHSRPRRNVGPPQFYGNRRFKDVVLEKDDTGASPSVFSSPTDIPRVTLTVSSLSGFLTPLAEAPPRQFLVAETTLSWSSKNSLPTVRPVTYEDSFPRQLLGLTLSLPDHERIPARDRQL